MNFYNNIIQLLLDQQLLTPQEGQNFKDAVDKSHLPPVQHLIEAGIFSAQDLLEKLVAISMLPGGKLSEIPLTAIPKTPLSYEYLIKHFILPLEITDRHIAIATADPTLQTVFEEITFITGLEVKPILVRVDELKNKLQDLQHRQFEAEFRHKKVGDNTLVVQIDLEKSNNTEDAPAVRFVQYVLEHALRHNASDIHFEPYHERYRVRLRIDGILQEFSAPDPMMANRISTRLKVLAQLDIADRRIPQDGRFQLKLGPLQKKTDFRVSTCPTICGEKIVVRLLDPLLNNLELETLAMLPTQQNMFLEYLRKSQGMILVTGPTGSGKTVTLYTAISILNKGTLNISTVEDPVEIHLNDINQVNINPKTGLTFASALRSFLRQDPDILMVGEMRDSETAEIALKAAQTGHLVLSTLHTNSAAESLSRLANMGIARFNIATSVVLIIAQRLIRKLCHHCKQLQSIPEELSASHIFAETKTIFKASGCELCLHGYKGRMAIYELLPIDSIISEKILAGASSIEINKTALKAGMLSLQESGFMRVREGLTTLEEISNF